MSGGLDLVVNLSDDQLQDLAEPPGTSSPPRYSSAPSRAAFRSGYESWHVAAPDAPTPDTGWKRHVYPSG